MNFLHKLGLLVAILGSSCLIKPQTVKAQSQTKPIPINLGFNGGTTITWDKSDEIIKKMWLDNPTFANIDVFGCIRGWNGCTESDAQIIHLKRNNDLKLKHIPATNTTLLTIITQNRQTKATSLHFYQITKASRTSQPLITAAVSPTVTRRATDPRSLSRFNMTPAEITSRIDLAVAKVEEQGRLSSKLQPLVVFSNMLKKGAQEQHALALSGVSIPLVEEVLKR